MISFYKRSYSEGIVIISIVFVIDRKNFPVQRTALHTRGSSYKTSNIMLPMNYELRSGRLIRNYLLSTGAAFDRIYSLIY